MEFADKNLNYLDRRVILISSKSTFFSVNLYFEDKLSP